MKETIIERRLFRLTLGIKSGPGENPPAPPTKDELNATDRILVRVVQLLGEMPCCHSPWCYRSDNLRSLTLACGLESDDEAEQVLRWARYAAPSYPELTFNLQLELRVTSDYVPDPDPCQESAIAEELKS